MLNPPAAVLGRAAVLRRAAVSGPAALGPAGRRATVATPCSPAADRNECSPAADRNECSPAVPGRNSQWSGPPCPRVTAGATGTQAFVRSTTAIDRIWPAPASGAMVVRTRDKLLALDTRTLDAAQESSKPLDPAGGRLLADRVYAEPHVLGNGAGLAVLRGGVLLHIDLTAGAEARRLLLPTLPHPVADALAAPDGRRALCVLRDESDMEAFAYSVQCVDAEARRAVAPLPLSARPPQIALASESSTCYVFDPAAESLWTVSMIDGRATAVDLARLRGRAISGMLVHTADRWLAMLSHDSEGRARLLHGSLSPAGVTWDTEARLPEGLVQFPRWRPAAREVAYLRTVRRKSVVERVDAFGRVLDSVELPLHWVAADINWSPAGDAILVATRGGIGILALVCSETARPAA